MIKALRMFLWMTFLTGIAYPLFITAFAQLAMKHKADGNFLFLNDKRIGAKNIAQRFESDQYFWPRPSHHDYNALQSGGSNFGPISKELKEAVEERQQKILQSHSGDKKLIPSELLFSSGSGLDPHISISTAYFQMERIAKSRKLQTNEIKKFIDERSLIQDFGLGEPYVNVLILNLALDEAIFIKSSQDSAERGKARSKRSDLTEEGMAPAMRDEEDRSGEAEAGRIPDEFIKIAEEVNHAQ